MSNDQTINLESNPSLVQPETPLTPEEIQRLQTQQLAEADERINEGSASPEDEALVEGFNAGANAALAEQEGQRTVEARTVSLGEDLLDTTNRQIQRLEDNIDVNRGWGEDTTEQQTELQGQRDMARYLEGRDYKDHNGNLHDAQSGKFKNESLANVKTSRSEQLDNTELKNLKLLEPDGLIDRWADAESRDLETVSSDIQDEILRRLENEVNLTDNLKLALIEQLHDKMLEKLGIEKTEPSNEKPITLPENGNEDVESPQLNDEEDPIEPQKEKEISSEEILSRLDEINTEINRLNEKVSTLETGRYSDGDTTENSSNKSQNPNETNNNSKNSEIDSNNKEGNRSIPGELCVDSEEKYAEASANYAISKLDVENIISGEDKKLKFENAAEELEKRFEEHINNIVELVADTDEDVRSLRMENAHIHDDAQSKLAELVSQRELAGDRYDGSLDEQIEQQQKLIDSAQANEAAFTERESRREADLQEFNLSELTKLSKNVDQAMLLERTRRHPKLSKLINWLDKHPKSRIAAGIGLTGLGLVGAATFNAPLVALAVSGKAALRGFGSYNLSRGIGEMIASKRLSKTEINTVDQYLEASKRQSATRRNSKMVGAAVSAVLTIVPAVVSILDNFNHTSNVIRPARPEAPSTSATANPSLDHIPTIKPVAENVLPWNYGMDVLHTNISSPEVLNKLTNNPFNIKFIGNGLGGGNGAITSVSIPGQGTFSDLGHINSAIAYVLGNRA